MPVTVQFDDKQLDGFGEDARERLHRALAAHGAWLIKTAAALEDVHRAHGGTKNITYTHVDDAVNQSGRRSLSRRSSKVVKIVGSVFTMIAGALLGTAYSSQGTRDQGSLLILVIVLTAAIVLEAVAVLRE